MSTRASPVWMHWPSTSRWCFRQSGSVSRREHRFRAALARSYNQFMATQCNRSAVAFFVCRHPTLAPADLAVHEIRRVKTLGSAAGIFARGLEWDRPLTHPDHWPIYQEAERQDLPVTVHTGNGSSPAISRMLEV